MGTFYVVLMSQRLTFHQYQINKEKSRERETKRQREKEREREKLFFIGEKYKMHKVLPL